MSDCTLCPKLVLSRSRIVWPEGNPKKAKVVIVGEAPGKQEDKEGKPFVGRSGAILNHLLALANIRREDCYITNVVKCYPGKRRKTPAPKERKTCAEKWLLTEIRNAAAPLVITLGAIALHAFLPNESLSQMHGNRIGWENKTIVPMYHPAATLYKASLAPILAADFLKLQLSSSSYSWDLLDEDAFSPPRVLSAFDLETTEPRIGRYFAPHLALPRGIAVAYD